MNDDNSLRNRPGLSDRSRGDESYLLFLAKIAHVDFERKMVTLQDLRTGDYFENILFLPANYSSVEATDVFVPETGATCLACSLYIRGGNWEVAIVSWNVADTVIAIDSIATRSIEEVEGRNERKRGTYRKAYPGQHSSVHTRGYTALQDEGWDQSGADFSRDKLDTYRRTRTLITSRRVEYNDGGLSFTGPVNRQNAANIPARRLPDGSQDYILYLQPNTAVSGRYKSGSQDLIPFAEQLDRVQEFALDYPLPLEVLETDLLDKVLGTTADPWKRTTVTGSPIQSDNETYLASQTWDNPLSKSGKAVGPTTQEGPTPARRAFIVERSSGTLVGYNRFDKVTYGYVLKPVLFPYTQQGRFGADVESSYLPVVESTNHDEARLAADAFMVRFPHEYNTTRIDVTKEGFTSLEVGSTIPKENNQFGSYEHPHGAGRSLEAHFVGSVKSVIGKNRDEEDALDAQILGQAVLRIGADDTSLPDARRSVHTQLRGQSDAVQQRKLQYWSASKLTPGDAGSLTNKTGAENVSLRAGLDGGTFLRLGARNPKSLRRHLVNGYKDGPGTQAYGVGDSSRIDSKSPGRPTYGAGDTTYAFHNLANAGKPVVDFLPYGWSGDPTAGNIDAHGLSFDLHAVRDVFLRLGQNELSGQSLLMDLAGGIAAWIGKDKQGRSMTASLDGGVEVTIGQNTQQKSLRVEFNGDVDWLIKGNFHLQVTGDTVWESSTHTHICKTDYITKAQKTITSSMVRHTVEAPDIVSNQGLYSSGENS